MLVPEGINPFIYLFLLRLLATTGRLPLLASLRIQTCVVSLQLNDFIDLPLGLDQSARNSVGRVGLLLTQIFEIFHPGVQAAPIGYPPIQQGSESGFPATLFPDSV